MDMSKKDYCPNCGAPMTGDVCEYCGTKRAGKDQGTEQAQQGQPSFAAHKKTWIIAVVAVAVLICISNVVNNIASRTGEAEDNWSDNSNNAVVVIETGINSILSSDETIEDETTEASTTEEVVLDGTRDNPVALGNTRFYHDSLYDFDVEVTITEVLRGSQAMAIIENARGFSKDPGEGKEYMLVKAKVKGLESKSERKISLSGSYNFECVSQSGVSYDHAYILNLQPEIADVYPGGETEGYICYAVDINDIPMVGFRGDGTAKTVWFATSAG